MNPPTLPTNEQIQQACRIVYEAMQPTAQYSWPLLNERVGTEVWIKHENHGPVGAFKIRGGLVYFRHLREQGRLEQNQPAGVIAATRGNHGQAVGFAARREGIPATVCVPFGNSASKNRAMRSLGVTLVEHGQDFEEARQEARRRAAVEGLHYVPSFHQWLVAGNSTYSYELFQAVDGIDVAYVPIGLGSGICGMCAARQALGRNTEIVGVVSAHAAAYYESFAQRRPVSRPADTKIADGMAVPVPDPDALELIWRHVARVVMVTDSEVEAAMRAIFDDTSNVAEGAGAAGVAAILKEKDRLRGKRVATVISGGNVDRQVVARVLGQSLAGGLS
ncbi:MAG TPA: threonine dehydratase [Candidatus Acidoferrales bacterium]|jgi:threonine dehydratase|nr:threonine dehydratase [Candidatus Acidoferrales bacterium]